MFKLALANTSRHVLLRSNVHVLEEVVYGTEASDFPTQALILLYAHFFLCCLIFFYIDEQ